MGKHHGLPFKVGELAEARSFLTGFRGAWFRCLIKGIAERDGHWSCSLEYFDFPDEKVIWARMFQKPPTAKGRSKELQLILRPPFPQSFRENEMQNLANSEEVAVIYRSSWKVGDLVDWWCQDCYWSGQITAMDGSDTVQITLFAPPLGEGGSYAASCNDLRPSLEWSPEDGWIVPKSQDENETLEPCARLIMTSKKDADGSLRVLHVQENNKQVNGNIKVGEECKKQSAGVPRLQTLKEDILMTKKPERSFEKGNIGLEIKSSDGKDLTDASVDQDGGRRTRREKKTKQCALMEVIRPMLSMEKRSIGTVEDCETNESVSGEGKAGKMKVTNGWFDTSSEGAFPLVKEYGGDKIQKIEGTGTVNRDEKTCNAMYGGRKTRVEDKAKNKASLSKKTMRKRSIDIGEHYKTGTTVLDGTTAEAEDMPTIDVKKAETEDIPSSCENCSYGTQDFSKNLGPSRYDYNLTIYPDTIESSVLALEELFNKIQWVKEHLQFGMKWTASRKPSWQFLDGPEA